MAWDAARKFLFSSSYDKTIICWDIGGQKGTTYDLEGHKDRVHSLVFVSPSSTSSMSGLAQQQPRQLVSGSDDQMLVVWDMNAKRSENPQWREADACEYCERPFFWNLKQMYLRTKKKKNLLVSSLI